MRGSQVRQSRARWNLKKVRPYERKLTLKPIRAYHGLLDLCEVADSSTKSVTPSENNDRGNNIPPSTAATSPIVSDITPPRPLLQAQFQHRIIAHSSCMTPLLTSFIAAGSVSVKK